MAKSKTGLVIQNTNRGVSSMYVVPAYRQNTVTPDYFIYVQRMQRLMEFALPKNIWDAGSCGAVPTTRYRGGRCQGKEAQQYELFVQEYRGQNCQTGQKCEVPCKNIGTKGPSYKRVKA